MKVELSKREIEAILEIMESGITFLTTHQWAGCSNYEKLYIDKKEKRERININDLMKKLQEAIND